MAEMDELLNSVTDEDGIRADFITAVRTAYDNDMSLNITAIDERNSRIGELESAIEAHESAIAQLNADHLAEVNAIKAQNFDKIMNGSEVDVTVSEPTADDTVNDYNSGNSSEFFQVDL